MTDPSAAAPIDPNDTLDTGDDFIPLGWMTGTIKESFWSTPMAESEGKQTEEWATKTRLYWLVEIESIDQPDYEGDIDSITLAFGVGKDWEFDESGRYAIHPNQAPLEDIVAGRARNKVFSPSSMYGMILDLSTGKTEAYDASSNVKELRVLDGGPAFEYDMKSVGQYLRANRLVDSRDATIWKGLKFLFRGAGFVYRNTEDPDNVRMTAVPMALCGVPDASAANPSPAPVTSNPPAAVVQGPNVPPVTTAAAPAAVSQFEPVPAAIPPATSAAAPAPVQAPQAAGQDPRSATLDAIRAAGADELTMTVLTKLAGNAANAGEFTRNASMLPAVAQDPTVQAMVAGAAGW